MLAAIFPALFAQPACADEYRLAIGDVVELTAVGMPDLRSRSAIGPDGNAVFPLLGPSKAAGLTLTELRALICKRMADRVLRQRSPDGREHPIVISPDEIGVGIAEYRPVYVNGDVSKPGEQKFRPGMTVHQAIAVAGGYEIMRFRLNNPFLEGIDFQANLSSNELELVRQSAYVKRLEAELDGLQTPSPTLGPPLTGEAKAIAEAENEQMRLRVDDHEKEKAYLSAAIQSVDDRARMLTEQQDKERSGTAADLEDLARVRELSKRGLSQATRLADARRMALLSSTSLLQTGASLGAVVREWQDLSRQLERLPEQRRLTLVRELMVARIEQRKQKVRIEALRKKLAYVGILRSQLANDANPPRIVITRANVGEVERFDSDEVGVLQPGDLVEVKIRVGEPGSRDDLAESGDSVSTHR